MISPAMFDGDTYLLEDCQAMAPPAQWCGCMAQYPRKYPKEASGISGEKALERRPQSQRS